MCIKPDPIELTVLGRESAPLAFDAPARKFRPIDVVPVKLKRMIVNGVPARKLSPIVTMFCILMFGFVTPEFCKNPSGYAVICESVFLKLVKFVQLYKKFLGTEVTFSVSVTDVMLVFGMLVVPILATHPETALSPGVRALT